MHHSKTKSILYLKKHNICSLFMYIGNQLTTHQNESKSKSACEDSVYTSLSRWDFDLHT